jgi:predicted transcriptional regulator
MKTKRIIFTLDSEVIKMLEELAKQEHCTKSVIINKLILKEKRESNV